eukprot:CAMPEP_0204336920 /NCGR_PEP_ID=MMETSP0469-20131031/19896_1 /ASSEMBLY_ACC=CAM_ASM_000384 /TAXON_ID=2969 /ORGANISM="Oxyrrhis marina" /LENGTH=76 /DNA_ID=CAMNT_0051320855 /DNA_START=1 /DNA_END=228 /DNA_ORIENTATION=+
MAARPEQAHNWAVPGVPRGVSFPARPTGGMPGGSPANQLKADERMEAGGTNSDRRALDLLMREIRKEVDKLDQDDW